MIKCQSQHELYAWLSKLVTGTGNFVFQTGELVRDFMGEDYMRMHYEEAEAFRELYNMRQAIDTQYIKTEKALIDRKEKLLKQGDLTKWGSGPFSCFKDEKQMAELKDKLL